jgi:hypothetical protein
MAQLPDTDRDGIPNSTDPFPTVNAVIADPDGNNNLSAGLQSGLIGRWDFETMAVSGTNHSFADIAGGDQPLSCRQLSMSIDNSGMISKGALFDAGNDHLAAPGTLFHNRTAFSTSMWFKIPPGYIQNKAGNIHTVFFACNGALDAYPELIVSIYKGVPGSTTQKITVSRYNGTTLTITFFGEIPVADYLDDGFWNHFAFVKNGNNSRLFVNGVKIKESNITNPTLTATTAGYISYGKTVPVATDQGHTFRGSMDRIRFYSRNLSDAEVTELYRQDSDRDGFPDIVEKDWGTTYPLSPFYWQSPEQDTDQDGLPDFWERLYGLDPLNTTGINGGTGDPDGDGIQNRFEYILGFHPKNASTGGTADASKDRDRDGMKDWQEAATAQWKWDSSQSKHVITKVLDWEVFDANGDFDNDGLTNILELNLHKTKPDFWDTDSDLLPDGWEVANGLNPNLATGSHGADGDADSDGLSNFREWTFGTKAGIGGGDSDGDGVRDGQEANQGSNPADSSDQGKAPSADELREFKIIIGDPSGSHSERWRVEVRDLATGKLVINHASRKYGELSTDAESVFKQFRKGKGYEFKLIWMDTDPVKRKEDPDNKFYPDYDWALEVSYKNEEGIWVDVKNTTSKRYLVLDPWNPQTKQLTKDNVKLLVNRNELQYPWEGKPDRTAQYQKQIVPHRVNLLPVEVAVDADRDGEITFDQKDKTTAEKPFRFWINNDEDNVEADEPILVETPDSFDNDIIQTKRDLEDFCRLKLNVGLSNQTLRDGDFQIGLMFRGSSGATPGIRIWKNQSDVGNLDYLKDHNAATAQIALGAFEKFPPLQVTLIPKDYWATRNDSTAHLIFEGTSKGKGELVVTIHDKYGAKLGEGSGIWMDLLDVREMYQRARVANEAEQIPPPATNPAPPAQTWKWDPWNWRYSEDPQATEKTAIFVHGWRLKYMDYMNWSDTSYKRLWHQGFKGKFYSFRWATFSGDNNGLPYGFDENIEGTAFPPGGTTYNASEYRAWLCGPTLASFVNQLPNAGNRSLFAHSMGNVIAGAALRSGMLIDRYAMCNAAMAAMAYDPDPILRNVDNIFIPGTLPELRDTPDTDPDPAIRTNYGLENKFNLSTMPEVFNFGLPDDTALGSWSANNLYFKPNTQYLYTENSILQPFPLVYQATPVSPYRSVTSIPEAMGYVTKSRTRAAGADLRTSGAITGGFTNMKNWFNDTHSAQWRWSNHSTELFWKELSISLILKEENP